MYYCTIKLMSATCHWSNRSIRLRADLVRVKGGVSGRGGCDGAQGGYARRAVKFRWVYVTSSRGFCTVVYTQTRV